MDKTLAEEVYLDESEISAAPEKKRVGISLAVFAILAACVGCGILFYKGPKAIEVQAFCFFLNGLLFSFLAHGKLAGTSRVRRSFLVLPAAIVASLVFAAFSYVYLRLPLLSVVSAATVFLIPVFVHLSWYFFNSIPTVLPELWYYRPDLPAAPKLVFFENIPLKIKLTDANGSLVKLTNTLPAQTQLGLAFYHLVTEKNNSGRTKIDWVDESGAPIGWAFYKKTFVFFKTPLHPEATVYENELRPKTVVIVEGHRPVANLK